jgi:hypothetical protein
MITHLTSLVQHGEPVSSDEDCAATGTPLAVRRDVLAIASRWSGALWQVDQLKLAILGSLSIYQPVALLY